MDAPPRLASPPAFAHWYNMLIGFGLVVIASAGICLALNLQKLVHLANVDPATGRQRVHFTKLPKWWVGALLNGASELVNLAALGFAPATLIVPLGCLTVLMNSLTAVFWLKEPFLRRDLWGLLLVSVGVACVVSSQVTCDTPLVTPAYLDVALRKPLFWSYVGLATASLVVLHVFVRPRYARRYSWVYLTESALFGSYTTVAARAFASLCGRPLPGDWANVSKPGAWPYFWGSLVILVSSAIASLMLQNKAMMIFDNSEVVPIYFCLFSVGGVAGAMMAYSEFCWPWLMLLLPGLALCITGVFSISFRRDARLAHEAEKRLTKGALSDGVSGNTSGRQSRQSVRHADPIEGMDGAEGFEGGAGADESASVRADSGHADGVSAPRPILSACASRLTDSRDSLLDGLTLGGGALSSFSASMRMAGSNSSSTLPAVGRESLLAHAQEPAGGASPVRGLVSNEAAVGRGGGRSHFRDPGDT